MSQTIQPPLEQFPDGAIQVFQGIIQDLNETARTHFPDLAAGMEVPSFLRPSLNDPDGTGTFSYHGTLYIFSLVSGGNHTLFLFRPAPQTALTNRQLDGFIRQMRTFLQDIMLEFQLMTKHMADERASIQNHMDAFSKSFCRVYRLLGNLDFMRSMGSPEGIPFHPVTMDLAGFCHSLTREAGDLLQEAGIRLKFHSPLPTLLTSADPTLLRKLLLTLLSNSSLAAPGGTVTLSLYTRQNRAILVLGDQGSCDTPLVDALFPDDQPSEEIPTPRSGAGMGMSIARHIVSLHKGTMLMEQREGHGLTCVLSLPLSPLTSRLPLHSPRVEEGIGLSPVLVELSDVLPLSLFREDD